MIAASNDAQTPLARDARYIRNLVQRVRLDGFGSNNGDWDSEKKIGAIAMPIIHEKKVLASLNIVYLTRALSTDEAAKKYIPALRSAVEKIAALIQEQKPFETAA